MVEKSIFGKHSTMYYLGKEHLFTSLYYYIQQGLENNEAIYVSMEKELYKSLVAGLAHNDESIAANIHFHSVKEFILGYKFGGVEHLKNLIENKVRNAIKDGYKGIRWIGQPTFAIQETSKQDFLNWEKGLTDSLKGTQCSLICVYDYEDYLTKQLTIDSEVIMHSLSTHTYVKEGVKLKNF